ncbi:MAG: hypothetical protein R2939_02690 [Kofleriaceae bacterium]
MSAGDDGPSRPPPRPGAAPPPRPGAPPPRPGPPSVAMGAMTPGAAPPGPPPVRPGPPSVAMGATPPSAEVPLPPPKPPSSPSGMRRAAPRPTADFIPPAATGAPLELAGEAPAPRGPVDAAPTRVAIGPRAQALAALREGATAAAPRRSGRGVLVVALVLGVGVVVSGVLWWRARGGATSAPVVAPATVDAAPAPPPPRKAIGPTGRLVLEIVPPRSKIRLDGHPYFFADGKAKFELFPGRHTLEIEGPGGARTTETVEIVAGEVLTHRLEAKPRGK